MEAGFSEQTSAIKNKSASAIRTIVGALSAGGPRTTRGQGGPGNPPEGEENQAFKAPCAGAHHFEACNGRTWS